MPLRSRTARRTAAPAVTFQIGWVLLLVVIAAAVATYEAFKRSNGDSQARARWFGGTRRSFSVVVVRPVEARRREPIEQRLRRGGGSKKW